MDYRIGILTSLYDDYAVELLQKIDQAIEEGFIPAKIPFIFCSRGKGMSAEVDGRIAAIEQLKNVEDLLIYPAKEFQPELRRQDRESWRLAYDRKVMKLLPNVDSYLNVGYMQIIGPEMLAKFDIVNLHPALPWLGPTGMWPRVMEEQAERPLPYLMSIEGDRLSNIISDVMNISWNKAGGMLHLVTNETDRGPVISWYEFPLLSRTLNKLYCDITVFLRGQSLDDLKKTGLWKELVQKIRQEQSKGELPLILLTYRKLARHEWIIKGKQLLINNQVFPGGYCLNYEIAKFLQDQGEKLPGVKLTP